MNSIPQTAATTFAFSSVCFFSMMLACLWHLNQKPICFTNRADLLRVMTGGGCEIKINVCSRARMRRSDKICVQRIYAAGGRLGKGDGKTYFSSYGRLGRSDGKTYICTGEEGLGGNCAPTPIFLQVGKAWKELLRDTFLCSWKRIGKATPKNHIFCTCKGLERATMRQLGKAWKRLPLNTVLWSWGRLGRGYHKIHC